MTYPNKTNRSHRSRFALLVLLAGLFVLTGCKSAPNPLSRYQRFHEAEYAGAVIKHDSWDYNFVLQPPVTDAGFRRILKAEDVGGVVRNHATSRYLAVILLGWQYSPEDHRRMGERWNELLRAEGFERVVCLKTTSETKLNGCPIVYDSAMAAPRVAALTP